MPTLDVEIWRRTEPGPRPRARPMGGRYRTRLSIAARRDLASVRSAVCSPDGRLVSGDVQGATEALFRFVQTACRPEYLASHAMKLGVVEALSARLGAREGLTEQLVGFAGRPGSPMGAREQGWTAPRGRRLVPARQRKP